MHLRLFAAPDGQAAALIRTLRKNSDLRDRQAALDSAWFRAL